MKKYVFKLHVSYFFKDSLSSFGFGEITITVTMDGEPKDRYPAMTEKILNDARGAAANSAGVQKCVIIAWNWLDPEDA